MFLPIDCTTLGCGERAVRWAPYCTGCGKPLVAATSATGGLSPDKELQFSPAGSAQIAPGLRWSASPVAGLLVVVSDEAPTIVRPSSEGVLVARAAWTFRGGERAALAFSRPWFALRDENPDGNDVLTIGSGGLMLQDLGPGPHGDLPTVAIPLRRSSCPTSATGRLSTLCPSSKGFFALEDAEGSADQTLLRHFVIKASSRAPWVPEWSEPSPAVRLPGRGWAIDKVAIRSPDRIGLLRASGAIATVEIAAAKPLNLRVKVLDSRMGEVVGLAQAGGDDLVCHLLQQGRSTLVSVAGNGAERTISAPTNAGLLSIAPTLRHNNAVVGARFDDSLAAVRPLQLDLTEPLRTVPKLSRVQGSNPDGLVAVDEHQRVVVESNQGCGMLRGNTAPAAIEKVAFAQLDWPHLWVVVGAEHGVYSVNRYVAHGHGR